MLQFFHPMIPMSANWIEEKTQLKKPQVHLLVEYMQTVLYNPAQIAKICVNMHRNISPTINQNQVVNETFFANLISSINAIYPQNSSKQAEVEALKISWKNQF